MLNDLNARLETADRDAKAMAQLNEAAQYKRNEYEQLFKKYSELKAVTDREHDFKNREKLTEFLETKRKLDELNLSLTLKDGTIINETFAQKVDFCLSKYEKCAERCEQISGDINRIRKAIELQNNSSPENIKEQIKKSTNDVAKLEEQKAVLESNEPALSAKIEEFKQKLSLAQNKKSAFNPLLLILAIICAASAGALAYFVSPIAAAVACVVAAVLLTLSFVIKPQNTSAVALVQSELASANSALAESKTDKNLIQEQINNLNAQINNLSTVLNADAAVKEQRLADLTLKNDALSAEKAKADPDKI